MTQPSLAMALALASLSVGASAFADDDPAKLRPTAHASPTGPMPDSFEEDHLPPDHPPVAADEVDSKKLLEKLDAMQDELKDRPKTAEIEYALGNLYYENARYPEAIDYYRQLLERSTAPLQRYLAARAHTTRP